ncbi:MAG: hypothetical protein ACI85F_001982 [Bacteroidia bacterium]|jgi:hypothetical protein
MLQLRDKRAKKWLSVIRPMMLILLPIGQCMAQETLLNVDMVGLLRRKVQVKMRDYSFSEYKKDHVTYILDPNVSQRINYSSDTCSAIEYLVTSVYTSDFEKRLSQFVDSLGIDFQKQSVRNRTQFSITKRVLPTAFVQKKKKRGNKKKRLQIPAIATGTSKERMAADERYFKMQKRSEADDNSHVKILGWNKNKSR